MPPEDPDARPLRDGAGARVGSWSLRAQRNQRAHRGYYFDRERLRIASGGRRKGGTRKTRPRRARRQHAEYGVVRKTGRGVSRRRAAAVDPPPPRDRSGSADVVVSMGRAGGRRSRDDDLRRLGPLPGRARALRLHGGERGGAGAQTARAVKLIAARVFANWTAPVG